MSLAIVHTRASLGLDAPLVTVEVHLSGGLPALTIVGLPEAAVRESKDRVRSALINSGFEFPQRRITINLAPADLPKDGGRFDLAIALGILAANGQLSVESLKDCEFLGELALSGEVRAIPGVLPASICARDAGHVLFAPSANVNEAARPKDAVVYGATHLLDVVSHLLGNSALSAHQCQHSTQTREPLPDLADVRGQHRARRALEIAAAGNHSLLMLGPPGTGKTMLASRLPSLLPPLEEHSALEVAAVRSLLGETVTFSEYPPFRAPHHTASSAAMVGGGSMPKPGEITLAHNGVLFLDELPEFDRKVLEVLREPLESGHVTISRAARQMRFPAQFQLVAAMNPCPCGYASSADGRCKCTPEQIARYRGRLSGPLLDRIDLHVEVPALPTSELQQKTAGESSAVVSARVNKARATQLKRQQNLNHLLSNQQLDAVCALNDSLRLFLEQAMTKLRLSARAYHRVLRVARTIADLEGHEQLQQTHLAEALSFRVLDRHRASV